MIKIKYFDKDEKFTLKPKLGVRAEVHYFDDKDNLLKIEYYHIVVHDDKHSFLST